MKEVIVVYYFVLILCLLMKLQIYAKMIARMDILLTLLH